jgi:hypothetical protein
LKEYSKTIQYFSGLESSAEVGFLRKAEITHVLVDQFNLENGLGFEKIALDSGAYRAWKEKRQLSADSYLEFLRALSQGIGIGRFEFITGLDDMTDPAQSYINWLRCWPEFPVVPVWHLGEPPADLEKYLKYGIRLMGIGGIAKLLHEKNTRQGTLDALCQIVELYQEVDFHMFGLNWVKAIETLNGKIYSFDTSKFLAGGRYSAIVFKHTINGHLMQVHVKHLPEYAHLRNDREGRIIACARNLKRFIDGPSEDRHESKSRTDVGIDS